MYSTHRFPVPDEFNEYTAVPVTNNAPKPFIGGHAGKKFTIEPGATVFVQWDAICRWAGNPFAVNHGADRADHWRTGELDRLSTLYGVYDDPWRTEEPHEIHPEGAPLGMKPIEYVQRADGWYYHPNLPDLTVKDSRGNELKTVLVDPIGEDVTPAEATSIAERQSIQAQLDELRRLQAQLQMQMATNATATPVNPEFEQNMVTDTPSVTPEPRDNIPGKPTVGDPRSTTTGQRRGPGRPPKSA